MIENLGVLDFALASEDRAMIDRLGSPNGRVNGASRWSPAWDKA